MFIDMKYVLISIICKFSHLSGKIKYTIQALMLGHLCHKLQKKFSVTVFSIVDDFESLYPNYDGKITWILQTHLAFEIE